MSTTTPFPYIIPHTYTRAIDVVSSLSLFSWIVFLGPPSCVVKSRVQTDHSFRFISLHSLSPSLSASRQTSLSVDRMRLEVICSMQVKIPKRR